MEKLFVTSKSRFVLNMNLGLKVIHHVKLFRKWGLKPRKKTFVDKLGYPWVPNPKS